MERVRTQFGSTRWNLLATRCRKKLSDKAPFSKGTLWNRVGYGKQSTLPAIYFLNASNASLR